MTSGTHRWIALLVVATAACTRAETSPITLTVAPPPGTVAMAKVWSVTPDGAVPAMVFRLHTPAFRSAHLGGAVHSLIDREKTWHKLWHGEAPAVDFTRWKIVAVRTWTHEIGEPLHAAYAQGRNLVFVLDDAHAARARRASRGVAFYLVAREVREVEFERAGPDE